MTFPSTHPALARALATRGYTVPTAVQKAVIEAPNPTADLLVSAQTGSGKTVAFGMAIAATLLGEAERFERAEAPLALIIAPTRELAMQVQRELEWLYGETGARIVTCVGGMDARSEARALNAGAHIVVGTPGRLRDHLERKRLDLATLKTIVLDEADEMLDLGFREDLEFILDATPETRQTLLFSATMPREIETLARRYQRDAQRIETLRRDEQHADIEYRAIRVSPQDIEHAVVNVLRYHEMRATLVFCATREAVKRLHARLVERGFSAVALSGELTQHERTTALQALRDGRARVLVATDVAARGLDLPDLALVIHADLPNDRETLLHRSGRTGRAGRKGLCTLIVPYNRRRKAETLLGAARLTVTWGTAPTADDIRARDQERFVADPMFTEAASDEDQTDVKALQAARSADEIALALVRLHRARLPAPEDLADDAGPPRRDDRARPARSDRFEKRGSFTRNDEDRGPRDTTRPPRDDRGPPRERAPAKARFEDGREMVWYRLNIGRERNADPRWLLPLICRAGGVTKAEIGSIKIFDRDTRFQIVAEFAEQFDHAVRTAKNKEGHIARVGAHLPADTVTVENPAVISTLVPRETQATPRDETAGNATRKYIRPAPGDEQVHGARPKYERPHRDSTDRARPPADRPARDYTSKDRAFSDRPREERGGGGERSSDARDTRPGAPRGKPAWQNRNKPNAAGHGPRKRPGKPPFEVSTDTLAPRHGKGDPLKPASKYAHKKKHRATPPAKS
ncbi:MAG: DEAD/DEAH box helicase [Hyphomicrobium sp.]